MGENAEDQYEISKDGLLGLGDSPLDWCKCCGYDQRRCRVRWKRRSGSREGSRVDGAAVDQEEARPFEALVTVRVQAGLAEEVGKGHRHSTHITSISQLI